MFAFGVDPVIMLVIMAVGVMVFGKNLPAISKRVSLGIAEFRRGMAEVMSEEPSGASLSYKDETDDLVPNAYRFTPP